MRPNEENINKNDVNIQSTEIKTVPQQNNIPFQNRNTSNYPEPFEISSPLNETDDVYVFSKPSVRIQFIKKVYSILFVQLLTTTLFCAAVIFNEELKKFMLLNSWILYISIVVSIGTTYALVCYPDNARKIPLNYILLSFFTFAESVMVSYITGVADPTNVLIALILTVGIVFALTIYAFTTKTDFTICGGLMFMLCVTFLLMIFLSIFIQNRIFVIVVSAFGVILFGVYLIFDTQLIVGKHQNKLSIDDYIIGAMKLYLDIINLFLQILKILSSSR